jgi:trimethylamine:corrinoid methyltransferase-like protein
MVPRLSGGMPVDLRTMCWAWGSPRSHLYQYLSARALPALCGLSPDDYAASYAFMSTSSCAVDARAGMEKMATALVAAMQGARAFCGAGNLAVDDLFSGIQLVVDVEIFEYVRELIESFAPHPDILATEGLYEVLRQVALGQDEFYSHPDTAAKVRSLLPVSPRRPSEKLRAWLTHERTMKDLIREECRQRIRNQPPFALAEDRRRELERIYLRAQAELRE